MGKILGSKADREALKKAREALHSNPDTAETRRYERLNKAVIDAEKKVPWLGR